MRIQHNIAALNAYRQLGGNNSAVSSNLEKLSSGYRINRAGDDAAGLAISEKMRAQITGLETASTNAEDGISLIQTAEGALTEVHSMLNRMVELATQSANGTYGEQERNKLQDEVTALKDEIDRISESTNFNGINLLDGNMGGTVDGVKFDGTVGTNSKAIVIEGLEGDAVKKLSITTAVNSTSNGDGSASVSYNKTTGALSLTITAKESTGTGIEVTAADVEAELKAAGFSNAKVTGADLAVTAQAATDVTLTADKAARATVKDSTGKVTVTANKIGYAYNGDFTIVATDDTTEEANLTGNAASLQLKETKDYAAKDINKMLAAVGAEYTVDFSGTMTGNELDALTDGTSELTLAGGAGSEGGGLSLQVGDTNDSFQKVEVNVESMSASSLGLAAVDVSSQESAGNSIQAIKDAIEKVSTARSDLGALQNRLDHTVNNLGVTTENLTAAESRIRDVDMAQEMMAFTKNNILTQASQAMLAQANQIPQGVLQLLQ